MEEFDLFAPQTFIPSTKQACRQLGNVTYVMEKRSQGACTIYVF